MSKSLTGTAHFSRPCPMCGEVMNVGCLMKKQMVGDEVLWMHAGCWRAGGVARYSRDLDREFRQVALSELWARRAVKDE